jgi:hypothetical protein
MVFRVCLILLLLFVVLTRLLVMDHGFSLLCWGEDCCESESSFTMLNDGGWLVEDDGETKEEPRLTFDGITKLILKTLH